MIDCQTIRVKANIFEWIIMIKTEEKILPTNDDDFYSMGRRNKPVLSVKKVKLNR